MNARHWLKVPTTLGALGLLLLAGAAQAGDVYWTVGVNAPLVRAGDVRAEFSNAPRYDSSRIMLVQQPIVIQQRAPVYQVQPVVYQSAPRWAHGHQAARWHGWHHRHDHRGGPDRYERGDRRDDHRGGGDQQRHERRWHD